MEKHRQGESPKREDKRRTRSKREKVRREKMQACEKVGKSRFTVLIWGSGGSKSNLAKAAGAEPAGQMRD